MNEKWLSIVPDFTVKRLFDLLVSLVLLVMLLPILLIVALLVAVGSPGGIFYVQRRVGRWGKTFRMYKFRSMVKGADLTGTYCTAVNDIRVTRVGRFLRATSIDEVPQLFNVLRGEMSLVGPRPDVPAQRSLYTESEWNLRNSVRPGITGLAQVVARNSATQSERTALDLEYVRSVSLSRDLKIIMRTIGNLFSKLSY